MSVSSSCVIVLFLLNIGTYGKTFGSSFFKGADCGINIGLFFFLEKNLGIIVCLDDLVVGT